MLQVIEPGGFIDEMDNGDEGGTQTVTVDQTVSGRYLIVVKGFRSTTGQFDLSVSST